eukprot:g1300.t1
MSSSETSPVLESQRKILMMYREDQRDYIKRQAVKTQQPSILLTYAQTLNGVIGIHQNSEVQCEGEKTKKRKRKRNTEARNPLIISGDDSMLLTHNLRNLVDGILVGSSTVIYDNPSLTVRRPSLFNEPKRDPTPIVLVSNLAKWFANFHIYYAGQEHSGETANAVEPQIPKLLLNPKTIILTGDRSAHQWQIYLKKKYECTITLHCIRCGENRPDLNENRPDLKTALQLLYTQYGMKSIMVEGGKKILEAFSSGRRRQAFDITQYIITVSQRVFTPDQNTKEISEIVTIPDCQLDVESDICLRKCFQVGNDVVMYSKCQH